MHDWMLHGNEHREIIDMLMLSVFYTLCEKRHVRNVALFAVINLSLSKKVLDLLLFKNTLYVWI